MMTWCIENHFKVLIWSQNRAWFGLYRPYPHAMSMRCLCYRLAPLPDLEIYNPDKSEILDEHASLRLPLFESVLRGRFDATPRNAYFPLDIGRFSRTNSSWVIIAQLIENYFNRFLPTSNPAWTILASQIEYTWYKFSASHLVQSTSILTQHYRYMFIYSLSSFTLNPSHCVLSPHQGWVNQSLSLNLG